MCVCLLAGCGAGEDASVQEELKPTPAPASLAVSSSESTSAPAAAVEEALILHIEPRIRAEGSAKIIYPYVYDASAAETINEAVASTVDQLLEASEDELNADYSIEYNANGFISILLHLYNPDDYGQYQLYPLTFNARNGELYTIADLFGSNDRWRWKLPDIITEQAEKSGITLLSSPLPIGDDQSFYLSGSDLVLVYRYYEIATYSAGIPQFPVPLNELSDFVGEDAPLFGLL
ncbi:MAG: RsiV family protein [Bacillota bacterium]